MGSDHFIFNRPPNRPLEAKAKDPHLHHRKDGNVLSKNPEKSKFGYKTCLAVVKEHILYYSNNLLHPDHLWNHSLCLLLTGKNCIIILALGYDHIKTCSVCGSCSSTLMEDGKSSKAKQNRINQQGMMELVTTLPAMK